MADPEASLTLATAREMFTALDDSIKGMDDFNADAHATAIVAVVLVKVLFKASPTDEGRRIIADGVIKSALRLSGSIENLRKDEKCILSKPPPSPESTWSSGRKHWSKTRN